MNYAEPEIVVQVTELNEAKRGALEKLGFKTDEEESTQFERAHVHGDKAALVIEDLANVREAETLKAPMETIAPIAELLKPILANPALLQNPQIVGFLNRIAELILPGPGFRWQAETGPGGPGGDPQQMVEAMTVIAGKAAEAKATELGEILGQKWIQPTQQQLAQLTQEMAGLAQALAQTKQETQAIAQATGQQKSEMELLGQAVAKLAEMLRAVAAPGPPMPEPVPVVPTPQMGPPVPAGIPLL